MFDPPDRISMIVCSLVAQGVCFKYFSEPPYLEGLALRGKVTPGKEYTGPDPAESSLGEAPPDFYCVIGEDEGLAGILYQRSMLQVMLPRGVVIRARPPGSVPRPR